MKCLLAVALFFAVVAAGCQDLPQSESVTPDDMFLQESKPVGDPSADPYREGVTPLLKIPTGPKPEKNQ